MRQFSRAMLRQSRDNDGRISDDRRQQSLAFRDETPDTSRLDQWLFLGNTTVYQPGFSIGPRVL
jgi:hypothetical protein